MITNFYNESWVDIPNYKGYYQISNYGRIKSLKRRYRRHDKIKTPFFSDEIGLVVISLSKNNTTILYPLVAIIDYSTRYNNQRKLIKSIT